MHCGVRLDGRNACYVIFWNIASKYWLYMDSGYCNSFYFYLWAWEIFRKLFQSTLNSIAPYKQIKIKQNSEPWMTSEILDTIRKRDQYLISYKKNR